MSMIKSNYQIDGSDLHPISNLLMEANAAAVASSSNFKIPFQQHQHNNNNSSSSPLVNSLTPILVATNNLQNVVNPNVISNGSFNFLIMIFFVVVK